MYMIPTQNGRHMLAGKSMPHCSYITSILGCGCCVDLCHNIRASAAPMTIMQQLCVCFNQSISVTRSVDQSR